MTTIARSLTDSKTEKSMTGQQHVQFGDELPVDFNWNAQTHPLVPIPRLLPGEPTPQQAAQVELVSECLRDGLHGVEVYPSVDAMLHYIEKLYAFGVTRVTVGIYSGDNNRVDTTIRQLLARLRDEMPAIIPIVLCLATPASLQWAANCKNIHPRLEPLVFMGTAPSRRLVQGWHLDFVLKQLAGAVAEAVRLGMTVIGASEHSTQTPPDDFREIIRVQIEEGASTFVIADTIGIARPRGAYRIAAFTRRTLDELGAKHVKLEWHGHQDTGNAIANAMLAIAAGASRIHVVARGIGERAGNVPLEGIALNINSILEEAGRPCPWKMSTIFDVLKCYEEMAEVPAPAFGMLARRYNHTTLGIHADALLKAHLLAAKAAEFGRYELAHQLRDMARRIYSAVDPESIGDQMSVGVSPWSGQNTVKLAYLLCGGDPDSLHAEEINRILNAAKERGRELDLPELRQIFWPKLAA